MIIEIYSEEIPAILQNGILDRFKKNLNNIIKFSFDSYISTHRLIFICKESNEEILQKIEIAFQNTIKDLPRSMKWPQSEYKWIRPIRNICVLGCKDVKKFLDLNVNSSTFIDSKKINVTEDNYFHILKQNNIIINQDIRKSIIQEYIRNFETKNNISLLSSNKLIDEVVGLTEQIYILEFEIPSKFMHLPPELMKLVLEKNQKYIIFTDKTLNYRNISKHFLIVAKCNENNKDIVKSGNQKVINARLEDAIFCWNKDRNITVETLQNRLQHLYLVENISYNALAKIQSQYTNEAKILWLIMYAKLDLVTETVAEFPEIQGIVGSYLCNSWNKGDNVAKVAFKLQYQRLNYDIINESINELNDKDKLILLKFLLLDKIIIIDELIKAGKNPTSRGDQFSIKQKVDDFIQLLIYFHNIENINITNDLLFNITDDAKILFLKRFILFQEKINPKLKTIVQNFCEILEKENIKSKNFFVDIIKIWKIITNIYQDETKIRILGRLIGLKNDKNDKNFTKFVNQNEISLISEKNLLIIEKYLDNTMINDNDKNIANARKAILNKIYVNNFYYENQILLDKILIFFIQKKLFNSSKV